MKKLILSTCVMFVSLAAFTSPALSLEGEETEPGKKVSLKIIIQDIEISIEKWMTDTDYLEIVIESPDELLIEPWMTRELNIETAETEPELAIEPWMQDPGYIKKYSTNTFLN